MMFYFESISQIWIILIGFQDTNDFVNLSICKHEFKFTCRSCCRFTLNCKIVHTVWKDCVRVSRSEGCGPGVE